MKVISLLNHKGGVGKTTLCTNLAQGLRVIHPVSVVMLVDADPQGSLRDWHDASMGVPGIDVVGADRRQTLMGIPQIAVSRAVNYLIIDTPGDMKEIHGTAISLSDLVIIPIRPSPYDVWATVDTIDLVLAAMTVDADLKAMFILNQAIQHSTITSDVMSALKEHAQIVLAKQHICHRVAFAKSVNTGGTIYDSKDNLAIQEMNNLTHEVLESLGESHE